MEKRLRQKFNDKVEKYGNKIYTGLGDILTTEVDKKGVLELGLVGIIGLGTVGCVTGGLGEYETNTVRNIKRSPITEKQSPYHFEEFSMRGEIYDVLKPKNIEVNGEVHNVPYIVLRDDMREVIDDDGKIVKIKPYNIYALVPVSFEGNKLKVVKKGVKDKRENIELDLKMPALPKREGFSETKRHSSETPYNLNRLGLILTKKGNYIFENTQEVYSLGNSVLESLPIGWIPKKGSFRILDRKYNRIDLDGYLIKAVKGKFAEKSVAETTSKTSTPPKITLKSDDLEGIDVNESKYVSLPVSSTLDFGSYHALIVGINEYHHLPYLKTATNDARTLAKILENDYGFQVTLLLNSTRADILTTLRKYREVLRGHDNLLIYYAGHGWLDKAADEGYWLPADATRDNEVNWISNANITSTIRAMRAKHVMIVADSCYSGKLVRGIHIKTKTPDYLTRISRKKARVVLSAGGLEPVADSGGKGAHSVFASAFIETLRQNTGVLDGTTLFTIVRKQVGWNAEQTPEYAIIHKAGHDGGDFLFVRPAVRANDGRGAEQDKD